MRKVPADCLVSIAASRYSVPVQYVGQTVSVHESATHFEIFHAASLIARHEKSRRHSVVMDPEHYRGLLRAGRNSSTQPPPPQWDPAYLGLGEVAVRNLAVYDTIAQSGGES